MKYIETLHYVEDSFQEKPSFIIKMQHDDDTFHNYISNGCVFVEDTAENVDALIEEHNCAEELKQLRHSPSIASNDILDASYMFYKSKINSLGDNTFDNVLNADHMLEYTDIAEIPSNFLPSAISCRHLFYGSKVSQ